MRTTPHVFTALIFVACSSPEPAPRGAAPEPAAAAAAAPAEPSGSTPSEAVPSAGELEIVEDVVRAHHGDVEACAAAQHATEPALGGTIEVRWGVAADGVVGAAALVSSTLATAAASDGGEPARALERCVLAAIGGWRYPPVIDGHAVTVHHTFTIASAAPAPIAADPAALPPGAGIGVGVGVSIGSSATPTIPLPRVRTGVADVRGTYSREIVRRVIRRHINEVRFCYEQTLVTAPSLEGRVAVHFEIDATGAVARPSLASSTLSSEGTADGGAPARRLEACIVGAVARWTFPAPDGGAAVAVDYPFVLDSDPDVPVASPTGPHGGSFGFGGMGLVGS